MARSLPNASRQRPMLQSKATGWNAASEALQSSNDNGRGETDLGPGSVPAQSGVSRIAIAGPVEEGLIASLLQMWANATSTGRLEVRSQREEGEIRFRHGAIVHAQFGSSLGQSACFRVLSLATGEFRYRADHTDEEPPTPAEKATAREEIQELLFAWVRLTRQ